MLDTEQTKLQF